jgi:hypothetical protein
MSNAYRARLRGNVLEWLTEKPRQCAADSVVDVDVIIVEHREEGRDSSQGQHMAAALERIAVLGAQTLPSDAAAWQTETRADRALPGRD